MLPIYLILYSNVVFLCHSSMANDLPWITISTTDMNYPIYSQLFVLIIMDFVSKVVSLIYFWIKGPSCGILSSFLSIRVNFFKNFSNFCLANMNSFQDNCVFNTMSYLQEQRICKFSIYRINLFKYRNNCIKIYL